MALPAQDSDRAPFCHRSENIHVVQSVHLSYRTALAPQRMAEQFESLTLTAASGPGQSESVDPASLPRPVGEQLAKALAPQPPADPGNCSSDNMRMTVNAIPISTALRARQVARGVVSRGRAGRGGRALRWRCGQGRWRAVWLRMPPPGPGRRRGWGEGHIAGLGWRAQGFRVVRCNWLRLAGWVNGFWCGLRSEQAWK